MIYINNNNNITKPENKLQKQYGAILIFMIIGFLGWMTNIFLNTFSNSKNTNIVIDIFLALFTIFSTIYIGRILIFYCEAKNLKIFGSQSRMIGISISIAVYFLLKISFKII